MNDHKLEWLSNRIKKNLKRLQPLAKKWNTNCYRIYDKDIPEIPYQIDRLDEDFWITEKGLRQHEVNHDLVLSNRENISTCLKNVFNCEEQNLWWQRRQEGNIELDTNSHKEIEVKEGKAKFLLKLGTYRDTGLFLDHRPLRLHLAQQGMASPLKVLNLFCYTSSFSVHLALNGHETTNVDLSHTYLNWSKKNFELNGLDISQHSFLQADVLKWLNNSTELSQYFDLIILDPPSFSNSKRMANEVLDIQRDHASLINQCLKLLKPKTGKLYFSCNLRSFKIDLQTVEMKYNLEDISVKTIPEDFKDKKIHHCFKIGL